MQKDWTNDELSELLYTKSDFALTVIFEIYSKILLNYFVQKYKSINRDDIGSIVTDSMLNLVDNPEKYDKSKSSLKTYLIRDIHGDLKNSFKKRKLTVVELVEENGNNKNEYHLEVEEQIAQIKEFIKNVFNNELDCQIAWMIEIDKERKTEDYIEPLQIHHLPYSQQQIEVKKHKDRIQAQLKRKGWKEFLKTLQ